MCLLPLISTFPVLLPFLLETKNRCFFILLLGRLSVLSTIMLCHRGDFVLGVSFRRGDFVRGDFVRTPAGVAHDAPRTPVVGWRGDIPPHTRPHSAYLPRRCSRLLRLDRRAPDTIHATGHATGHHHLLTLRLCLDHIVLDLWIFAEP